MTLKYLAILMGCLTIVLGCDTVAQDNPVTKHVTAQDRVSGQVDEGPISQDEKLGQDWPSFLGPTTDGKSIETGILKDWSDGKLKIAWRTPTGEGYGIGSVVDGRFYHFGRYGENAVLKCLQAETGDPLWEFSYASDYRDLFGYDSGPRASPVIDAGCVYIYGVEGMLHCLDSITGKEIWKQNTTERFGVIQNFFGVASTPVVHQNLLWVMVGGSPAESKAIPARQLSLVKPNGTGMVAFDKRTGEIEFQCVNDLASYCSLKLATLDGSPTLLAWMRGGLFGLDPADGAVRFQFPWRARVLESVNASTPVVRNGQILISECYGKGTAVLEPRPNDLTPDLIWSDGRVRDKALEAHWNTPIEVDGKVFGCSGRHAGSAELRCLDWATGEVYWSQPGLSRSSLTYVDGHFVVLGEHGKLLLIKATPEKFDVVTEYEPGSGDAGIRFKSPCWAAPVISQGLMYVRGKNEMVCFQLIQPAE